MLSMKRNRPKLVAAVDFSPASVAAARWAAMPRFQDLAGGTA